MAGREADRAVNAVEALGLLEVERREVDFLLTDVVMAGMSGAELAAEVRRSHPNLRVLSCPA